MKIPFFHKKHASNQPPRHGLFHHIGQDAAVDWSFIFILFLLTTIGLLAFGAYTYISLDARMTDTSHKVGSSLSLFDDKSLKAVMKQFDDTAAEEMRLERGYSGVADPSFQ